MKRTKLIPEKAETWWEGLCEWYSPSPVAVPLYCTIREFMSQVAIWSICVHEGDEIGEQGMLPY